MPRPVSAPGPTAIRAAPSRRGTLPRAHSGRRERGAALYRARGCGLPLRVRPEHRRATLAIRPYRRCSHSGSHGWKTRCDNGRSSQGHPRSEPGHPFLSRSAGMDPGRWDTQLWPWLCDRRRDRLADADRPLVPAREDGYPIRGEVLKSPLGRAQSGPFGNIAYADGVIVVVTPTQVWGYVSEARRFGPPDPQTEGGPAFREFERLLERTESALARGEERSARALLVAAARGPFTRSCRAWAAARLLLLSPRATDESRLPADVRSALAPDLRDEWLFSPDGLPITLGRLVDHHLGRAAALRSSFSQPPRDCERPSPVRRRCSRAPTSPEPSASPPGRRRFRHSRRDHATEESLRHHRCRAAGSPPGAERAIAVRDPGSIHPRRRPARWLRRGWSARGSPVRR